MDRFYYQYGGIHLVIIDGIADLLSGVNDEESSVHLIEELFRMAAIYNTLIVCVVHLAPSGLKLRGHLGSEVQREAAGILLIEREEDQNVSVVKALKVRDGSPLDVPMTQFGWSKTEGRHVYLGERSKEDSQQRKISDLKTAAVEIFKGGAIVHTKQLQAALMEAFAVRDRTARSYIVSMLEHKNHREIEAISQQFQACRVKIPAKTTFSPPFCSGFRGFFRAKLKKTNPAVIWKSASRKMGRFCLSHG
jgi:hypothetical protein